MIDLPSPFLPDDKVILIAVNRMWSDPEMEVGAEYTVAVQDPDGDVYMVERRSNGRPFFGFQDDFALADGRLWSNPAYPARVGGERAARKWRTANMREARLPSAPDRPWWKFWAPR